MKFKSARASLAAVLTVALLISILPAVSASATGQTGQGTSSSRARRGKNGDQAAKSNASQDLASADSDQTPNSTPETSKPATVPVSDNPAKDSTRSFSTLDNPVDSQQQREAPPFDRPPIGSQSQPRPQQQPTKNQRPSYSENDNRQGSNSDRNSQSGNEADRDSSDRGGQPPVLHRPSDSRSGDNGSGQRPPVLRRPTDPASDQDNSGERRRDQRGEGARPQQGDDDVIKLESTLVNLPLLVSDRSGRYVPQLSKQDFLLYEDGVQQTIASFGSEEVPFNVALMLDVSPSVAGSIKDIQDAAIEFVRQLRSQDRVMVVAFDRGIHYLTEFTNDRRQLEWAIRGTRTGSGTSVYDAVYETVDRKLRNVEGRKAMILFSDGEDTTSSRAGYDDTVNLVGESDVLVYGLRYPGTGGGGGVRVDPWPRTIPRNPIPRLPIPLPFPWPMPRRRGPFNLSDSNSGGNAAVQSWPRRKNHGGDFMKDITAAGGGPVYDAENIGDMSRVASRIADELRHVYVISYYPTNPLSNGGYRRVRVSVKGRDEIAVRHRPGYNARPNGSARPTI